MPACVWQAADPVYPSTFHKAMAPLLQHLSSAYPAQIQYEPTQSSFLQAYTYYADPVVESVQPEAGPRWGSFQMTVFLQQDVLAMPGLQVQPADTVHQ